MTQRMTLMKIASVKAARRCTCFSAQGEGCAKQLLLGLIDDITLNLIAPKLLWRELSLLSSVSLAWHHAIQTHKVYNARVCSHSADTHVLVSYYCCSQGKNAIALYSPRDNSYSRLATIPGHSHEEFPIGAKEISVDGKLYVFGGKMIDLDCAYKSSKEVYMLDLAGQQQWKKCASMTVPRDRFGCGVMHGNIYVFGGAHSSKDVCRSEVYHPRLYRWSPIKSMLSEIFNASVGILEEELVVYTCNHMEAYHPIKDEWRVREQFWKDRFAALRFVANGRFYEIAGGKDNDTGVDRICVSNDGDERAWRHLHRLCDKDVIEDPTLRDMVTVDEALREDPTLGDYIAFGSSILPWFVKVVDDEHLAIVTDGESCKARLLKIKGLGGDNKIIKWEKAQSFFSSPVANYWSSFMRSIQL